MPYGSDDCKTRQVEVMFDSIAPAYDFMNTAMTFGLHRMWRRRALKRALAIAGVERATKGEGMHILDVATGTGDLVFALHRDLPEARICGIDLSEGMLGVARSKLASTPGSERLEFMKGDSLALPYADDSFNLVTVAYGVRNFERMEDGYREMLRVLKPGGVICIIELSQPEKGLTRRLYDFYSRHLIPAIGRMVSGDSRAYTYLPESIAAAPQRDDMAAVMKRAGFSNTSWKSLTFGAVTCYFARK